MAKEDILINILLDRSGSMEGLASDVVGNYNAYIEGQKHLPGKATVSLVLFDDQYEEVYVGKDIESVPVLTKDTYFVRGSTAYIDALSKLIKSVDALRNKPSKVVFVVNTDGLENASREYTGEQLKAMIKHRQDKHDWQFVFMGAGIDAISVGTSLGNQVSNNVMYAATPQGVTWATNRLGDVTRSYRGGVSATMDFTDENNTTDNTTVVTP